MYTIFSREKEERKKRKEEGRKEGRKRKREKEGERVFCAKREFSNVRGWLRECT